MMKRLLLLTLWPAAALAECPPDPAQEQALSAVVSRFAKAPDRNVALDLHNRMWRVLTDAPDQTAQDYLDAGMERFRMGDFPAAIKAFDALTDYCPEYAEGYNQRAIIRFVQEDYEAALPDIDRALALTPQHLGAMTGKAMTLIALGRDAEAQVILKQALALNPWLPERALLKEPQGEEL
ncbi:tetratricopeptide repeat protein [Donghicola eburneus]|uniref:Putative tetratricopeptide repeat protein n=1 Tax=Donghicola eburneus TaxID=393278 RepID=A0A1M4MWX6_9RHOB|nr:tetratricopeptide repeat protein [Donghicola eburneus]SCM67052.1 putative tetratricopeptide repeat protein [Donghicola eburneus]SFQ73502.1 Tetratricopeptide repeat-containing protein [Donghicola eburneus]